MNQCGGQWLWGAIAGLSGFASIGGLPARASLPPATPVSTPTLEVAQLNNVSDLTDVAPSDWAYQALQNLVSTYGCIQGYPDRTFRGNQTMTRYEFAAGLNACLEAIAQYRSAGVSPDDLATIQRLQETFASELDLLSRRVDALEANVAELETQQFSTTTKLRGQVDSHLAVPFDTYDVGGTVEDSTTFLSRVRLNFSTTFTGRDRLLVRLQAASGNQVLSDFGGLTYVSPGGNPTLNVSVDDFFYQFPVGDQLTFRLAANSMKMNDFVSTNLIPFERQSVSDVGEQLFYQAGMNRNGAGLGVNFNITDNLVLDAGYSINPSDATNPTIGIFSGANTGRGRQSYLVQLSYVGDGWLQAGAAYLHGDGGETFRGAAAGPNGVNTYAGLLNLRFGDVTLAGNFAFHDFNGGSDTSWLAGIMVPDLWIEGSQLGIYGGQLPDVYNVAATTSNHWLIEGYYDFPVNQYLRITPAIIYGDSQAIAAEDGTTLYGVIRTTFRF